MDEREGFIVNLRETDFSRKNDEEQEEKEKEIEKGEEEDDDEEETYDEDVSVIAIVKKETETLERIETSNLCESLCRTRKKENSGKILANKKATTRKRKEEEDDNEEEEEEEVEEQERDDEDDEEKKNEDKSSADNRRIVAVTAKRSKMALQAKPLADKSLANESRKRESTGICEENIGILPSKFRSSDEAAPSSDRRSCKSDSDYVRDSSETSSSSSSSGGSSSGGSNYGYGVEKVKKIHRAIRNKSWASSTEVRRNPTRVGKKNMEKDFSRPRQRLLSVKRKDSFVNDPTSTSIATKCAKQSPTPYMNTRSVTRRLYNVGATYQAPTIRDETQWKEWPVHGMHERPIFHPQVGLATEYLGRCFVSLDGVSYREIVDQSEVEVVSVDPRNEWSSSGEKKRVKKVMTGIFRKSIDESQQQKANQENYGLPKMSFERNEAQGSEKRDFLESPRSYGRKHMDVASDTAHSNVKCAEEENLLEGYAIAMSQSIQNPMNLTKTSPWTSPIPTMFFTEPKLANTLTNVSNFQNAQLKFSNIVRPAPKNSLIFVKTSDPKAPACCSTSSCNRFFNTYATEMGPMGPVQLDNSMNNEKLMEVSPIYKNIIPNEESMSNREASPPIKSGLCRRTAMKYPAKPQDFVLTKCFFADKQENLQENANTKNPRSNFNERSSNFDIAAKENSDQTYGNSSNNSSSNNRSSTGTWCTNETSEIARILSEYNRSIARKPAIQPQTFCTTSKIQRPNILRPNSKDSREVSWNKEERPGDNCSRSDFADRNAGIKMPQGKWRRFHFTVEKLKDSKCTDNCVASTVVGNRQIPIRSTAPPIAATTIPNPVNRRENRRKPQNLYRNCALLQRSDSSISELNTEGQEFVATNPEGTTSKNQSLQDVLKNTTVLYCTTAGVHQNDLVHYIDTMDNKQGVQWLEPWNNSIA